MADEMRANDLVGLLLDDDLRPGHGLGEGAGREPAQHVVDLHAGLQPLLLRLLFRRPTVAKAGTVKTHEGMLA